MKTLDLLPRLFILSFITFAVLSCGKEQKLPITFTVRTSKTFLLPGSQPTCKEEGSGLTTQSLSERYFKFDTPEIEIDKAKLAQIYPELDMDSLVTDPTKLIFNIIGITIRIKSDYITGGEYKCVIAGEELKYLIYNETTGLQWDPAAIVYDSAYTKVGGTSSGEFRGTDYWRRIRTYSSCALKCGGVNVKNAAFTAPVTFEMIVVSSLKNPDGTQTDVPYKVSTTASIQNAF